MTRELEKVIFGQNRDELNVERCTPAGAAGQGLRNWSVVNSNCQGKGEVDGGVGKSTHPNSIMPKAYFFEIYYTFP